MTNWRPMAAFDPDKPALVHDRLNDQVMPGSPSDTAGTTGPAIAISAAA
jgi:hypothetical protein